MTAGRLRPTRRGRIVASAAALVAVAVALAALRGDGPVRGAGLTAGAAAVPVASPSPDASASPAGPRWRPAEAAPVPADGVVDRLVAEAPIVVVADLADRRDRDAATWLATALQAPVVVSSPTGPADVPVGTEVVVAVGDVEVARHQDVRRVAWERPVDAPRAGLAAGPLQVRRAVRVAAGGPPAGLDLAGVEDLLDRSRPAPDSGVVVLVRPGGAPLDDMVTALALGHRVVVTDATDARADARLRTALRDAGEATVGLLGGGWDAVDPGAWRWQLEVARRGPELPGGGQLVFPGRMIVALYGHPDGPALGVLGEQPLAATLERAAAQAGAYAPLVDVPVVPALEIIATVASASAGEHGDYSRRTPVAQLRPYVDAAREAGVFVILDLQPGRTDFLTQAKQYEELLREPHVGLALDPEWRLGPGERHLVRIGSVGADEVNAVVTWLADLTRTEALPQKLLVLHQFRHSMLADRQRIDTSRPELAMVLHVDGQGGQPAKLATYASMLRDLPAGVRIGWKNFHDEDRPMRSEAETVALDPRPDLVTYQ